jgi:cellulose synthase/poly-beta-1,6-N-acetylglucosamine synthase-like glycosyltransferase
MLVAILTSRDVEKLKRCIESVLPQTSDVIVVCNTLDFSFVEQARVVAEAYNLEFLVTESNGTPAKGKNSVLEIFRSRSHDYYMQVDADDYLTPDALSKIATIVQQNTDVDVIGLTNNFMTYNGGVTTFEDFFSSADIYKFANVKGSHGLRLIELGRFVTANLQINRMLFYSKKSVNNFNFDETFIGSEDVVASYKLYYNSDINYVLTDEHLYVYELQDNGNFHSFLSNPTEIKKVLRELKVIVNETRI